MVTITNGEKTFRVTAGAVKPYENMGFHVATEEEITEMKQTSLEHFDDSGMSDSTPSEENTDSTNDVEDEKDTSEEEGTSTEEDAFIEELLEKPMSQWNNEEIKEFVRIKGIDTSGAQKVSQVRGIIKNYLEEEQKKNS